MKATITTLAESPLAWEHLPRLRPTAGLAHEKHTWADEVFDGVPGLAIRKCQDPRPYPMVVPAGPSRPMPDRVALAGDGLEALVATLFEGGGILLTTDATTVCSGSEALQQACRTLLDDPTAALIAHRPSPRASTQQFIHPALSIGRASVETVGRLATALATARYAVPGIALYQHPSAGEPLALAVRRAAARLGIDVEWLAAAPPAAIELGLPRFDELPLDGTNALDLSGFNVAALPPAHPATRLILDHTAVVDLAPLEGWQSLDAVSLLGLELSSLERVRRLALETPSPAQLEQLAGVEHLTLHGGHLEDLRALGRLAGLRTLELDHVTLGSLCGVEALGALERLVLGCPTTPPLDPLEALPALGSLALRLRGRFDARRLPALPGLVELELTTLEGSEVALDHPEALGSSAALRSLDLTATNLSETHWLAALGSLRRLVLAATEVSAVPEVEQLRGLEHLDLSGTHLAHLPRLEALDLSLQRVRLAGLQIDDLAPISGPALVSLELHRASMRSLDPLRATPLQELELGGATFDCPARFDLPELRTLDLTALPLDSYAPLLGLSRLRELKVAWQRSRPDPAVLLQLPPLARLELDRSVVRGAVGEALALRHHLVLKGE